MSRLPALRAESALHAADHALVSWESWRLEPGVKVIAPPPGLASGRREVAPWVIGLLGGLSVILALGWIAYRAHQRRRATRDDR